jgi:hypothetical protein
MSQPDFNSAFRDLLHEPLPPAPDPRRLAFDLFQREQRRTYVLAALSVVFWVIGAAGIFLLVFSLNRIVMDAQLRSTVYMDADTGSIDHFVHQNLPPIAFTKICVVIEISVVALLIAAMLTVALVFSSRQATLQRINLSLMQISEHLMHSRQLAPGQEPPPGTVNALYSIPPAGWSIGSILTKLLLALVLVLLIGVPAMWLAARASAERAADAERAALAELQAARQLSPFEAVQWDGITPQVQVGGRWYELVSIDGLSAAQIVARCQALNPHDWKKRFEEDLVEVLNQTGHPIGDHTMLEVKDLQTGQVQTLMNVPLTRENLLAIWRAASTRPSDE